MNWTTLTLPNNRPPSLCRRGSLVGTLVLIILISLSPRLEADVDIHFITSWEFERPPAALLIAEYVRDHLLRKLVQEDDGLAQRLGFNFAGEILTPQFPLKLGVPFAVFRVGLKRVRAYQSGSDARTLLLDESNWLAVGTTPSVYFVPVRFLFPINIDGSVRSSTLASVPLSQSNWVLEKIGSPTLIRQLTKHGSGPAHFVVWIPALNRYYLGIIHAGIFKIKVIFPNDPIGLKEGDERSAEEIFQRLQREAIKIDPDDPNVAPR